jgi:hypothetical protein
MSGEWIKVVASLYLIWPRRLLKKASQQGLILWQGDGSVSDSSPSPFLLEQQHVAG